MKRIKLLVNIIRKRLSLLGIALLLLFISVAIRTLEPKVIQVIFDYLLQKNLTTSDITLNWIIQFIQIFRSYSLLYQILILAGLYVLMAAMRSVTILSSRAISYNASEKSVQEFRVRLFEHIQKIPMSAFNILNKGELIQRSTGDMDTIKNFISNHTIELIRLLTLFFFSAYMLFQINWQYALCCVSLTPLIFISTYLFFNYEGKVWQEHEDEADKLTNIAQENLNGIRTVKVYNQMASEIEKFNKQNEVKLKVGLKHMRLHTIFWPVNDMLLYVQTAIFILLGGIYVMNGEMSLGALVAAYTYNSMLGFPIKQAGRVLSQMSMAFVAIDRIQDILAQQVESKDGTLAKNLCGDIRFENVSFQYDATSKAVLSNVSFEMKGGEKLAIMGKSASGKTSLVKLLTRLYELSDGTITIDSKNIARYELSSLRNRIGYVMQQSTLFSMDLGENLAYAKSEASSEEKEQVLELAGFENYHTILPKGMHTQIGEKGVNLSGGQKQRLSLARTLIKDHDILILDDITSALDKNTEKKVLENVMRQAVDKTVWIITHRLSTLKYVDKVLVLNEQGKLQSFGEPELVRKTDSYLKELEEIEKNQIADMTI